MSEAAAKLLSEDSPETRLKALKAQRSVLTERIAGLTAARQQLDAATDGERAAAAALAELDAVEVAAARKWASTGAVGAAPSGEIGRRTKLVANLAAAQAAAAAARGAGAGLDAELAGLRAELANLAADIEAVALEVLETERLATLAELIKVAAHAGHLTAKLRAHQLSIGEHARALRDSGEQRRAQPLFVEAERLVAIPLPAPQPPAADIGAARKEWLARFAGLIE